MTWKLASQVCTSRHRHGRLWTRILEQDRGQVFVERRDFVHAKWKNDWNESRDIDDFYSSEVRICLLCDQAGWRWCLWSQRLRFSVSTLLRHSLPFFIIFCWENSWNTRTGERSIVQPEVLDNQYKIRSDASQPIVVRWSKDSDVVGWMNEWMNEWSFMFPFVAFLALPRRCWTVMLY